MNSNPERFFMWVVFILIACAILAGRFFGSECSTVVQIAAGHIREKNTGLLTGS